MCVNGRNFCLKGHLVEDEEAKKLNLLAFMTYQAVNDSPNLLSAN